MKKDNVLVLKKDTVLVLKKDNVLVLKKYNVLGPGDRGTRVPGRYKGPGDRGTRVSGSTNYTCSKLKRNTQKHEHPTITCL